MLYVRELLGIVQHRLDVVDEPLISPEDGADGFFMPA